MPSLTRLNDCRQGMADKSLTDVVFSCGFKTFSHCAPQTRPRTETHQDKIRNQAKHGIFAKGLPRRNTTKLQLMHRLDRSGRRRPKPTRAIRWQYRYDMRLLSADQPERYPKEKAAVRAERRRLHRPLCRISLLRNALDFASEKCRPSWTVDAMSHRASLVLSAS